jgi:hypothetical protein
VVSYGRTGADAQLAEETCELTADALAGDAKFGVDEGALQGFKKPAIGSVSSIILSQVMNVRCG